MATQRSGMPISRLPSFRNFTLPPIVFRSRSTRSYTEIRGGQRLEEDEEWQMLKSPVHKHQSPPAYNAWPPSQPGDSKPSSETEDYHSSKDYNPKDAKNSNDPNLVTWSSPDDPANPLNWPRRTRWTATVIVASFTFISPLASTMVAPSLSTIAKEFDITSQIEKALVMSIFLLAYAIGPFLLGPLSEIYGRVVVLQWSNMWFLVFNTACGFAQTKQQMMALRFLSGLGASAPQALGGGVLSDCWRAEERGKALAIYSLAPFLGPSVGPIAGGIITQNTTWRWVFWGTSIVDAFVQVLATLFLKETYAPKILATKAKKLRKETGNQDLYTEYDKDETFLQNLWHNLERPFVMLGTQPTIQVLALYRGYVYGLMYLVLATFSDVFEDIYGEPVGIASLNYLSLGIGFVVGLQICAPLIDGIYTRLKKKYKSEGRPEFRVPLMLPGGLLVPIGLLIYGFTSRADVHWIFPNIGAAIFGTGCIICFQCAQAYVVDAYTTYSASATGAAAFVRTMAGFGFPLFAPAMYGALGIAGGNALIAGLAIVIGVPAPILLWKYGERMRARSTYCAG